MAIRWTAVAKPWLFNATKCLGKRRRILPITCAWGCEKRAEAGTMQAGPESAVRDRKDGAVAGPAQVGRRRRNDSGRTPLHADGSAGTAQPQPPAHGTTGETAPARRLETASAPGPGAQRCPRKAPRRGAGLRRDGAAGEPPRQKAPSAAGGSLRVCARGRPGPPAGPLAAPPPGSRGAASATGSRSQGPSQLKQPFFGPSRRVQDPASDTEE